jgi:hypothetical protein
LNLRLIEGRDASFNYPLTILNLNQNKTVTRRVCAKFMLNEASLTWCAVRVP